MKKLIQENISLWETASVRPYQKKKRKPEGQRHTAYLPCAKCGKITKNIYKRVPVCSVRCMKNTENIVDQVRKSSKTYTNP